MRVLDANTFDQAVKETKGTLVVKFYADWCPDCRRIDGAYEEFPNRYPDQSFAEVDTEAAPDLASRYDVRGIPTFLVFKGGELVDRLYSRDAKSVQQVEQFVEKQRSAAQA